MDKKEYEKVKRLNYLQYCDYLQEKYGIGRSDCMTKSWNKNNKVSRTCDGLIAHHKYEDHAIMLSQKQIAMLNPFEWQKAENIVYCDYLEHLFLHILICENPAQDRNKNENVGIGGVCNFIVPELNDLYSGWATKQQWRKNCHEKVKNNKDVYFDLVKRFKEFQLKIIPLQVRIKTENIIRAVVSKKQEELIHSYAEKIIDEEDYNKKQARLDFISSALNASDKRENLFCKIGMEEQIKMLRKRFIEKLCSSFNEIYGSGWGKKNNKEIFSEIKKL
ncbi:hypothetical protein [uncultured Treponema sp.]|uniref:hypothetical protein n=1 Tax=uncultured Treponema sp. TaxID=162155 RepID=UPI0025F4C1DF|nr:hypothetical protein [uncultured Treponema sp.]